MYCIDEQYSQRVLMLQSIIKYEQDDLTGSKGLLDKCHGDDPDVIINYAAVAFKEGNYESARTQYSEAINTMGMYVCVNMSIRMKIRYINF